MPAIDSAKQVGKVLGTGAWLVAGVPIAVVASLASLAVMGYRTTKRISNLKSALDQVSTNEEQRYFTFGEKLLMPLKGSYNTYRDVLKYVSGDVLDLKEWTHTYNPHPLDPTQDLVAETDFDFELKNGWNQAKDVVIDFINSGGMKYDINLSSSDSVNTYVEKRNEIMNRLQHPEEVSDLTYELTTAKEELEALKEYLSEQFKQDANINPSRYLDHLQTLHTKMTVALEDQFQADNKAIEDLYGTDRSPAQNKTESLKQLKESHEKELKEIETKMAEDKKQLQEAANREINRITFLAYVYKHNPDMKDTFAELAKDADKQRKGTLTTSALGAKIIDGQLKISFKGIDPAKLEGFKAFGSTISAVKDKQGKITGYNMALASRLWPGNVFGLEEKTKHSITMLVKAIKASSGGDKITMTVDHPDPAHEMYLARKMFEVCREEGYDEKNITIQCKGKTIPIFDTAKGKDKDGNETVEEKGLLKSHGAKQAINARAEVYQTARTANFERLKKEMRDNRTAPEQSIEQEIKDAKKPQVDDASTPGTP